jgi:hypothetical protein
MPMFGQILSAAMGGGRGRQPAGMEPIPSDLVELSMLADPSESTPGDLGIDINQPQSAPRVSRKRRKRAVP